MTERAVTRCWFLGTLAQSTLLAQFSVSAKPASSLSCPNQPPSHTPPRSIEGVDWGPDWPQIKSRGARTGTPKLRLFL
ncbi:uncharacterized protein K444DRAFT_68241 [Hyaloscypha bicolor E]|uniref:Secreted protein n=1 Tax=Hyaloscypha bicolor E TaxID=1095630 RepID=A0A2J6T0M4_9HELO|nr:uncharacterized protein K444DRAFT_68241 [Hyaloscypha bicolor E]PMD56562.1 hypothetical protein K444DRAFT_68241 [Hyaloscypha bicolor E]